VYLGGYGHFHVFPASKAACIPARPPPIMGGWGLSYGLIFDLISDILVVTFLNLIKYLDGEIDAIHILDIQMRFSKYVHFLIMRKF